MELVFETIVIVLIGIGFIITLFKILWWACDMSKAEKLRREQEELRREQNRQYNELLDEIRQSLNLPYWKFTNASDANVKLQSAKSVDNYQIIQFFKDNKDKLNKILDELDRKYIYAKMLNNFLADNEYEERPMYDRVKETILQNIQQCLAYYVKVSYTSPAGRSTNHKTLRISKEDVEKVIEDPSCLMSKSEYNQHMKAKSKKELEQKQREYYDRINKIIDKANDFGSEIIIEGDKNELDKLIQSLFDRIVNGIRKIKNADNSEWSIIDNSICNTEQKLNDIINNNQQIIDYYESPAFAQINM